VAGFSHKLPVYTAFGLNHLYSVIRCKGYAWVMVLFGGLLAAPAHSDGLRDLTDGQEAAIFGSSAGLVLLGRLVTNSDHDTLARTDYRPNAFDRWVRGGLRGAGERPTNFLDSDLGGKMTPFVAFCALAILDIDRSEFSRDMPLFLAGVMATKGITDLGKSLFSRPRPYTLNRSLTYSPDEEHQRSFFSGHASSAFYTAAFFNKRFRRYMRQNWTSDEYRIGRWLSPLVTFGWAVIVGYSRVHADQHYLTDVAAGALVGALIGELYYHLGYTSESSSGADSSNEPAFMITLSFPL